MIGSSVWQAYSLARQNKLLRDRLRGLRQGVLAAHDAQTQFDSSVQHLASAIGAFASARFLTELPDHKLVGVDGTAYVSIGLSVCLIPLFWVVEHRLTRRARVAT